MTTRRRSLMMVDSPAPLRAPRPPVRERLRTLAARPRYYWDFLRLQIGMSRRARVWTKGYKRYLSGERAAPPFPPMLQIIPTEACNLTCGMCNQWGENGYLRKGLRKVSTMPLEKLIAFLRRFGELSPGFALSIHGGEPFAYKQMTPLLEYLATTDVDIIFSTNGTLLEPHAEALAKVNRRTLYLLSVDGGEGTNDSIRGPGTTQAIVEGVRAVRERCLGLGTGLPKIIVNYCLSELNPDDIDLVSEVAREVDALFVNYNLRWFLPKEKGEEYNAVLENEFDVRPTNAWKGWAAPPGFDENIDPAIDRIYRKQAKQRFWPSLPLAAMMPKRLTRAQAKLFYHDYAETFGIKACIMPSYWARVHSSGELIYCPGHPDIVPGNVFEQDFAEVFLNQVSEKLRRRVEEKLLPICNRCCGLYMTYTATQHLEKKFSGG